MFEFLSNPEWIKPQTDFLLFLQNYRLNSFDIFDKFFLSITILGEFWLPTVICAIIYWCIDFEAGCYLMSLEGFNMLFAHLSKMLACVYRPWILDSRIQPSALALPLAKGYSFPSGHSAMSSSVLGGLAYLFRKRKFLCISLIFIVLLIGFSRLWLGVHTPQDVICGLSIGFVLVFALNSLIKWADKDKRRYLYLLLAINVFAFLALIYLFFFKSYKMDYQEGELLVNPYSQRYVATVLYGFALGLLNGCYLCRFFFPFNPKDIPVKRRVLIGFIGAMGIIFLIRPLVAYLISNDTHTLIAALLMFISGLTVTLIYPLIFVHIHNLLKK